MLYSKNKIKLSPRLRWGVGRDTRKFDFYKIGGGIFSIFILGLLINAGWLLITPNNSPSDNTPQVLGEIDNQQTELFSEYQVKNGDTLFSIAREYNVEWTMLATINNLKAPFTLQVNRTIKIPKR
ncbi:MAG TPA: LysM domain-containing protein [Candidatus Doudnabacteria bacterium]|nr:LysM domain-containing protein [Candidatus Doudnabacteria bacterium]